MIRTSAIDRLISEAIVGGVDTVLNLGAGLDSRPYRLKLPPSLRWVELDFPTIVDFKDRELAGREPVCSLERVEIDLRDRPGLTKLLHRFAATSTNMLVITEGVLPYLAVHDVAALAGELIATRSITSWIQDFDDTGPRRLPRGWESKLRAAPLLFEVNDWFEFFERNGWRTSHAITSHEESQRLNRPYPLDVPHGILFRLFPHGMRRQILSTSGAVLLQRMKTTPKYIGESHL